jgi:hypothetical protein
MMHPSALSFSRIMVLAGVMLISILSALCCAGAAVGAAPREAVDWLQAPVDDAAIEFRMTSVDKDGKRRIAGVSVDYARRTGLSHMTVAVEEKDQPKRLFCFKCNAANTLLSCSGQDGVTPDATGTFVPGTLLPWHALTVGFCQTFKTVENKQFADAQYDVLDVRFSGRGGKKPACSLRVIISRATKHPEKIVYVDAKGRETAVIEIHEIRRTVGGRVITRSTYHDLQTQSRVLMELRSGSVGLPDDEKGR